MLRFTTTGQLTVRPITATVTKEFSFISKLSAYCLCIMGGFTSKTKVIENCNKTAIWNDIFTYNRGQETEITLQVFNKRLIHKDEMLGECKIRLEEVLIKGRIEDTYKLWCMGKDAGSINVRIEWRTEQIPTNFSQNIQNINQIFIPRGPLPPPPIGFNYNNQSSNPFFYNNQSNIDRQPKYQPEVTNYYNNGPNNNILPPPPVFTGCSNNYNNQWNNFPNNSNLDYNNKQNNTNNGFPLVYNSNDKILMNQQISIPPINDIQQDDQQRAFDYPKENEVMTDVEFQKKMTEGKLN